MSQNLLLRLCSTLAFVPVVLLLLWNGGFIYDLLIAFVMLGAFSEWIGLTNPKVRERVRLIGMTGIAACLFSVSVFGFFFAFVLSLFVWLAVLLSAGRFPKADRDAHRGKALWLSGGIPYLVWSGIALIMLRNGMDDGYVYALYVMLVVWATDTGAYIAGRSIGGPKLLPQISPKKTWAGLCGGMLLAAAAGYGVMAYFGTADPVMAFVLGAVLAVVAQAGDFFESYVKRRVNAKDSGTLIPGHGGLLDRIDGLLFVAMLMFVIMIIG